MLAQRFKSFYFALKGIYILFKEEINARIHLLVALSVILSGWMLKISITEWCLVTLCITLVIMAEAFNTAIENLTDLVSPDIHPLAGKTKDLAAGAVLIISIGSSIVGLVIFLPKLSAFFLSFSGNIFAF